MSDILRACLVKEWREQRHIVLAVSILAPLAVVACCFLLPGDRVDIEGVLSKVAAACVLIVVVAIGSDTIPGEVRGRGMALLTRLPGGLAPAFLAKLGLLLGAMAALGIWGFACAVIGRALLLGGSLLPEDLVWTAALLPFVLTVLALATWLLAVSSWVPRAGIAILATLLLGGAAVLPPALPQLAGARLREVEPWWRDSWWLGAAAVGGALVAWLSFVRGYAHSGGPKRAAALGAPAVGIALALLLVPAARTLAVWRWADPSSPTFRIFHAFCGADGRHAFLNTTQQGFERHSHALVVDLTTGDWRQEGPPNTFFQTPESLHGGLWEAGRFSVVLRANADPKGNFGRTWQCLDTTTLATLAEATPEEIRSPEAMLADRLRASLRATTPHRTPDGRRIWPFGRGLERETAEGGFEVVPIPAGLVPIGLGQHFGFYVTAPAGRWRGWFDPTRGRAFAVERDQHCVLVRPSLWLIGRQTGNSKQRDCPTFDWQLRDPETGIEQPALGFEADDSLAYFCIDADEVLVVGAGGVFVVDPERGSRQAIACDLEPGPLRSAIAVGRTPGDAHILSIHVRRQTTTGGHASERFLARLDDRALRLTFCRVPNVDLVAALDEETLIVKTDRALLRVRFGSDESEQVFPRDP